MAASANHEGEVEETKPASETTATSSSSAKSPALKGAAAKSNSGSDTKPKKKASPKKAKSKAKADSDGASSEPAQKKASPKKRKTKATTTDDSGDIKEKSPKKKAKAAEHQRWTERTPLTRHWNPATAMSNHGSYTFTVISWNVAGLRTFIKKNPDALSELASKYQADVICLQETKLQVENLEDPKLKLKEYFSEKMEGYDAHFSCSVEKKGYSGTAMFIRKHGGGGEEEGKKGKKQATLGAFFAKKGGEESKANDATANDFGVKSTGDVQVAHLQPIDVATELGMSAHDGEGRTITAEFPLFYLTNVYVPNSGQKLERLGYRTNSWDKDFLTKMQQLEKDGDKPIIWVGDLNVAFDEKDTWNEGAKHLAKSAGTTAEERASFAEQLGAGYIDAFRHLHPEGRGHYSYWSQRAGNREPNKGLRLDYFVCSKGIMGDGDGTKAIVRDSYMVPDQLGSDHCPIVLEIEIKK